MVRESEREKNCTVKAVSVLKKRCLLDGPILKDGPEIVACSTMFIKEDN